jgi:hypothetical protein
MADHVDETHPQPIARREFLKAGLALPMLVRLDAPRFRYHITSSEVL